MPNIKIGDNALTGVSELQCTNADDTTQQVIFYSAPRAILIVTAPAGSTLDITRNNIVLQSYTLGASETTHEFKVDVDIVEYVIKASLLDKRKNRTVSIMAPTTYNIKITYSNLPEGYTELTYIESSGTQYINTGVTASNSLEFSIRMMLFSGIATGTDLIMFGMINSSSRYHFGWVYSGFGTGYSTSFTFNNPNVEFTFSFKNKVLSDGFSTWNATSTSTISGLNCFLFARNSGGSANLHMRARVYSMTITNGSTTLRNFVPAIRESDNAIGLLDIAQSTAVFYGNNGSGKFIAGPEA